MKKTFGIITSVAMWAVAVWAIAQPVKETFHVVVIATAAIVMLVHFIEVSFYFWHPKMKQHLTAYNIGMTLLCGVYHFMPLYKGKQL